MSDSNNAKQTKEATTDQPVQSEQPIGTTDNSVADGSAGGTAPSGVRPAVIPALAQLGSIINRANVGQAMSAAVSRLVNDQEDTMELHTREAMMLFVGRDSSEERRFGVPGARHAAGALRQLFVLTARDNPYADLVLLEVDNRAKLIRDKIAEHRSRHFNRLEALRRMGLNYSLVRAQVPQSVTLGYYSPYGYTMSTLVVMYDECVRVLKSAERRDLISRAELHDALYDMKHSIRSLFDVVLKGQRTLCNDNMRPLSRADFAPGVADPKAAKRVEAAQKILGQLPEEVYAGRVSPRHSMRRERITEAEQRLLDAVAKQLQEPTALPAPQNDAAATDGLVD